MGLKSLKHDTILVLKPNLAKTGSSKWSKPSRIDTTDSYTFCRDCGTALGWFLENDLSKETIRHEWKLLIGENGHGKTPGFLKPQIRIWKIMQCVTVNFIFSVKSKPFHFNHPFSEVIF